MERLTIVGRLGIGGICIFNLQQRPGSLGFVKGHAACMLHGDGVHAGAALMRVKI
jgi:hypothetical protein